MSASAVMVVLVTRESDVRTADISGTPVWTLTTQDRPETLPIPVGDHLTPERLAELRSALAAFSETPLVTLEAHALPSHRPAGGMALDSASPLARELARLMKTQSERVPQVTKIAESGEVLYRMVVPAKVAGQMGSGLVKSMAPKAGSKPGVYDALVHATSGKVVAKATFVPVSGTAAGATAGASVGTAATTAAAGSALTVAAPLVLMAVAVGMSAHAEQQRQEAINHITDLLEKLQDAQLDSERNALDGCQDAIEKATALLLDRGKVGASLGLDSASYAISTAIRAAARRTQKWESALDTYEDDRPEVDDLEGAFPGITSVGGEFRAHLELAALAIALKRRVVILQGVEAGQSAENNPFENFMRSLKDDQRRIDQLEGRIERVLLRLSTLELRSPSRLLDRLMTRKQVDELLESSYRLRALGNATSTSSGEGDVVIEVEKHKDGMLYVLPPHTA